MMKKSVATVILNRNLPRPTNKLYEVISKNESNLTDIFVLEAGSDEDKLSPYTTWHANWPEARANGLRYCRGMNYAIWSLWKENKLFEYDYLFLLSNDVELIFENTIKRMIDVFRSHQYLGILSPCSQKWGEYKLLKELNIKYFWFIHNSAYMININLIKDIAFFEEDYMHTLYDGTNFRGYGAEQELIAKAYFNGWASAITNQALANENESYLIDKSDLIKTDSYEVNRQLYLQEGLIWMKKKYGFDSHWAMNNYVKFAYEQFFDDHPQLKIYKI